MVRYRTGDITGILAEPCPCGRTIRRINRIARRSDDMIIVRGVNIFPSQVEAALLDAEGVHPHYEIVLTRERGMDEMEVKVEAAEEILRSADCGTAEGVHRQLSTAIARMLGIRVKLTLAAPNTIPRSQGKAKRVIDEREKPFA
jgi:phenylacetate-CoA ligase